MEVVLPLALNVEYTYRIPQELNEEVAIGKRVVVQFGKRKIYTGIISQVSEQGPKDYQAKYILSVLDNTPLITEVQLGFWRWIASYYLCTLGEVMQAALPPSLKLESQSRVFINPEAEIDESNLDVHEIPILHQLRMAESLTLDELEKLTHRRSNYKYIQSLYERGYVIIDEGIEETYKPLIVRYIRISKAYREEQQLKQLFQQMEARAALQLHILMKMVQLDAGYEGVDKNAFIKEHKLSSSSVKTLIAKGILEEESRQVERIVYKGQEEPSINILTEEQEEAFKQIKEAFEQDKTVLLQGITSSGKTHIYIKLIEEAIADGGQVLYLLPEISLTTQLIRRIQAYFGEKVLVHHSRFNQNERQEIWTRIRNSDQSILIAPRSGVFMPFTNLKLVIVDEEHENTFKQSEPNPRYHARDASIVLAAHHKAHVVLGSATPSVESKYNAEIAKYITVGLEGRFRGVEVPEFLVVDMVEERKQKRRKGIFSSVLLEKIQQTVANQEQVMLFQNRKGYVPITECEDCSWTPKCIHCDISLTYYRYENKLRCHYCGYNTPPFSECQACKSTSLSMIGYGTERIEQELLNIFPDLRVQRLDYESTRTKSAFENIITAFEKREIDVLIGTQMIAKGLDFEHLRLVGIVDADHALNFPDFRAYERAFQLFTQVAGRAGRRDKIGEVIIQTNQPQHHVIQDVIDYNYERFYRREINDRKKFYYPPFVRLVRITLKHKDRNLVALGADQLAVLLKAGLEDSVMGPLEPHVGRIRNNYIRHMMIKIIPPKSILAVKDYVSQCVHKMKVNKKLGRIRVLVDVDPN